MRYFVCFVVIILPIAVGSINILVNGYDEECVFLEREKGQRLGIAVLTDGNKVDVTVFSGNDVQLLEVPAITDYERQFDINETTSYQFCFANIHSTSRVNVGFYYSEEIEQFDEEKTLLWKHARDYAENQDPSLDIQTNTNSLDFLNNIKLFNAMKDALQQLRIRTYYGEGKNFDDALKGYVTMISIYIELLESSLMLRKSHYRREYHLQLSNNRNVMVYSIIITCAIVIVSLVQLIMVKSFINGKISFKVWLY